MQRYKIKPNKDTFNLKNMIKNYYRVPTVHKGVVHIQKKEAIKLPLIF